ncbi:MAG: cysteine desulfurase NifS [Filifactoraceae bacterium]
MRVYMDNSATTPVKEEVIKAMLPCYGEYFGNPSSVHGFGRDVKAIMESARETVANVIGADASEIYFTSGGSEADNWAIKGVAEKLSGKGNHIITTKIEHHAVLHTCEYLENKGYEITYLDVDKDGLINLVDLESKITDKTILISIMYANNEIGTIEPIEEIGKIAKKYNILFHTDAVQALGKVEIDVKKLGVDMMSISGHKIHAPKGTGALYIRKGLIVENLIHGGGQERKRRAGTENIAGIVAFAKACEISKRDFIEHNKKLVKLRDSLIEKIITQIPHTIVTGSRESRLSSVASFCFEFIEGESLLLMLDMNGIAGSSGSACTSGSLDPSHVLMAIGLKHEVAHGSLRLSLSDLNTEEEVDYVVEKLSAIVERLRSMSPLYEDFIKGGK